MINHRDIASYEELAFAMEQHGEELFHRPVHNVRFNLAFYDKLSVVVSDHFVGFNNKFPVAGNPTENHVTASGLYGDIIVDVTTANVDVLGHYMIRRGSNYDNNFFKTVPIHQFSQTFQYYGEMDRMSRYKFRVFMFSQDWESLAANAILTR